MAKIKVPLGVSVTTVVGAIAGPPSVTSSGYSLIPLTASAANKILLADGRNNVTIVAGILAPSQAISCMN